jgi:hypothetical protein
MALGIYILKGKRPVLIEDIITWGKYMGKGSLNRKRHVALTKMGEFEVSTVFLGIDHSFRKEAPILFETMIFKEAPGSLFGCEA